MKAAIKLLCVVLLAISCSGNNASKTGTGEPLVIKVQLPNKTIVLAQFIAGPLPGTVPTDSGLGTGGNSSLDADAGTPKVLQATFQDSERFVVPGQANVAINGLTSKDVAAVGLALEGFSTGYWVVPVGFLDGATQQPTWEAIADFGPNIPPGYRNVNYVAVDGNGHAGLLQSQKVCVASRYPNYFPGCQASPKTPAAVISLSWDTNVDLDLQVQAPDGSLIDSKNPVTVDIDASTPIVPADAGYIDRDSNGYCAIDGIRNENLIWQNVAPNGPYGIYVNLFDACKQPVVHFNVSVYTAVTGDGGNKTLQSWYSADGILLDFQANGGSNRGFFVSEFNFQ